MGSRRAAPAAVGGTTTYKKTVIKEKKEKWQLISYCSYYKIQLAILLNKDYICRKKGGYKYSDKTNLSRMERAPKSMYEVSTPMRCIAPMDVVSKAELRSENTH